MANNTYEQFKSLRTQINAVPELKDNRAVQAALTDMEKGFKGNEAFYDGAADLVKALSSSIPKFTDPRSNTADVVSGILDITAAVVKMVGVASGLRAFSGPASTVLRLAGAIIGVFGVSDKTKYAEVINQMIKDAVDNLNSELINQDIAGTLAVMAADHNSMATCLAETYTDPSVLLSAKTGMSATHIIEQGEKELGKAFENIAINVSTDKRGNWYNAAGTFFHATQLLGYRALFLLEGIAYCDLAESNDTDTTATLMVTSELTRFKGKYSKVAAPYFTRPELRTAVITQWIYRQPQLNLTIMRVVYDFLIGGRVGYFTLQYYRFTCNVNKRHDVDLPNEKGLCVRLTTLSAHDEDGKNRMLEIPADNNKVEYSETVYTEYEAKGISNQDVDFHYHSKGDKPERSHFYFFTNTPGSGPFNDWTLVGKNMIYEKAYWERNGAKYYNLKMRVQKDHFFVFEVFPTDSELENKDKIFPNQWTARPKAGKHYYIIGSNNRDLVWCDHNGKDFKMETYYNVAFNKSSYGNPEQCLFYFMGQDEK